MTLSQPHLEEEHKADPLIEGVPDNLLLVVEVRDGANPGVGDHHAHLLADQLRQGEGGVDPAVGVHDTLRDLTLKSGQYCYPLLASFGQKSEETYIHNAVNRVSEELSDGHNDAGSEEDESGDLAVESEHQVVYPYLQLTLLVMGLYPYRILPTLDHLV